MKLSAWLKLRKITQDAFAHTMGVRRETVIRWCNGDATPDMPTINRIADETEHAVTALDWSDQVRARNSAAAASAEAESR